MLPIKSFISPEQVKELASRSYFRYGEKLREDAEIKFTKTNNFNLLATVQLGNKNLQTVELQSTTKGFRYKCTCSSKKNLFCEHCVAVALVWNDQSK